MIEDIKSGSSLNFASGKLKELCKLLPDKEEVLVTAAYSFFMWLMCSVNHKTVVVVILPIIWNLVLIFVAYFGSLNERRWSSWSVLRVIILLSQKQICLCYCWSRFPGELQLQFLKVIQMLNTCGGSLMKETLCLLVMKSASTAWWSKRNFFPSWMKWKNSSAL